MKRCDFRGKKKYRDAGEASADIKPGEQRFLYRCKSCGFWHLTRGRPVP